MLNRAEIIGFLGKDPETRTNQAGEMRAFLNVATSKSWTDKKNGSRQEETTWHRVAIRNVHLAKIVKQYAHKGSKIYVAGAIRNFKYTDAQGVERYGNEIAVSRFTGEVIILDKPVQPELGDAAEPELAGAAT